MDHKKLITELQKRSGLDKSRLNSLLLATERVICEQAIYLNHVSLGPLGVFESQKKLEFVYENPQTGEQVLYPPRIILRFIPSPEIKTALEKEIPHE